MKNYYEELDIARGIAILGVITIHTSSLYLSRTYNYNLKIINILAQFSVPLFIFISGFLHKNIFVFEGDKERRYYIYKRFRRIIFPYLFFSIVYMFIRIIIENTPYLNSFLPIRYNSIEYIIQAILLVKNNPAGHLYFLPLLFLVFLVFTLLEILFKKKKTLYITCIIISSLAYAFWGNIYLSLNPLKGIGFYAMGYALRDSPFYNKLYNLNSYIVLFLSLFLIFIIGYLNISIALIKHIFAFGMQIFGALFIYQISLYLCKSQSKQIFSLTLSNIGKYSFDIYLLHEPYIVTVFFVVLIQLSLINVVLNQSILLDLGIIIPLLLSHLWLRRNRIFRQYLLGLD